MEEYDRMRLEEYRKRLVQNISHSQFLEYELSSNFTAERRRLNDIIHEEETQKILPFLEEIQQAYISGLKYQGPKD